MTTVAEYQTITSAAAAAVLSQANSYLTALTSAADVQFSNGFNIDQELPDLYNYSDVPTVNFPIVSGGLRPTVTGVATAGPPEATALSFDAPAAIALPADDLLAPTNSFAYAEGAYDRILLDPLQAKLLADLQNGGYGIDTTDEDALFDRARDREVLAALTRIKEAGRTMASRGFPLPPGELSIHIDRAYQEMQDKVSGVSREIFVNSAARFVENRKFTITESREMERITMAFYNSIQERAVNVSKATAELGIAVYNQLVARYKARLDATKLTGDVQFQVSQVKVEQAKAFIDDFRGRVLAYEADLRRQVEPLKLQVDLYQADIAANRNLTDGLIARAQLQQKVIDATVQQNVQISGLNIELAKAKLLATVKGLEFKTTAAQFGAKEFFSALTAMYSSINSLAVQTATE